jgi:glycosyltransferase involved in cell wall biosynthesis
MTLPFVVFSDDWGEHPSSSQHLFGQLADEHRILWVNTIGMRRPTLSLTDLGKVVSKVGRMLKRSPAGAVPKAPPNIRVCQPFMLPYSNIGAVRRLNRASVVRSVGQAVRTAGMVDPVLVTTVPNACDYAATVRKDLVVYYCVDDFSAWPGLDASLVRGMEDMLVQRADVLLATSRKLYERLAASGKPVHMLTHGVDIELFGREASAEHPCLAGLRRPRAGYFGLIDARTDKRLLEAVARRMPDFELVLTGRVETAVEALAALSNVHFTGPVPYRELPDLIAGLDVLLLPYAVNEFSDTLSPLKMKEYLATGKPVVSTPIAEARALREYVTLAGTAEEWEAGLRAALSVDVPQRKRAIAPVMRGESWGAKAERLQTLCEEALQGRRRIDA